MYGNSSIVYKIWMRVYCDFCDKSARILWFLRQLRVCCDFCTIARMLWFLHSSFSVAAAANHEQFWELNLQYIRGRVFINFRRNPKVISLAQEEEYLSNTPQQSICNTAFEFLTPRFLKSSLLCSLFFCTFVENHCKITYHTTFSTTNTYLPPFSTTTDL